MSIDYNDLRRTIEEIEQGVNATTKYSWIELAQEVLRMSNELKEISAIWESASVNPDRISAEQILAAQVVDHIDSVLGDHDE